jgi:hypothetical protein
MQMPFHVAPGLGDMAPGWFALPQNPLTMGQSTVLVPTMGATVPGRWVRTPHLADLVQASFAVPQNPVRNNLAAGLASLRGMGCPGFGCDGGREFYSLNGLGQTPGTDPVSQFLNTNLGAPGAWLADETTFMSFSLPMWGWLAGGFAAAYVASDLFSKGKAASKRYAGRYAQNPPGNRAIAGYGSTTMNGRKRRRNPPGNRAIAGYGSTTMNPPGRVITGYGSTVMNGAGRTNVVFNGRRRRIAA